MIATFTREIGQRIFPSQILMQKQMCSYKVLKIQTFTYTIKFFY